METRDKMNRISTYHIFSALMIFNLLFSITNAFSNPNALTIFSAYFCVSPILLMSGAIDRMWLTMNTKSTLFLHFRAMMLWPISWYESHQYKKTIRSIHKLIVEIGTADNPGTIDSAKLDELANLHKKLDALTGNTRKPTK